MAEGPCTDDGTPIGGWVLRSTDPASVIADLKEFGQVFRFPLPGGPRCDLLDAGQPCFLYVSQPGNPKVKPGIWAVGEVVGPVTVGLAEEHEGSTTDGDPIADEQLFAEVELIPLQQRITLGELNDHRVLVDTELIDRPDQPNPLVLRPHEVRALEEWDFALVEPTPEQVARLDEVLDEDDAGIVFQLFGVDRSLGIVDDGGEDGLLSVVSVDGADEDGDAYEIGRYLEFADALEAVAAHAGALDLDPPVPIVDGVPQGDPVAQLRAADGLITLHRVGEETFDLWDGGTDAARLARFESLADALAGLAEAVEEIAPEPDSGDDA